MNVLKNKGKSISFALLITLVFLFSFTITATFAWITSKNVKSAELQIEKIKVTAELTNKNSSSTLSFGDVIASGVKVNLATGLPEGEEQMSAPSCVRVQIKFSSPTQDKDVAVHKLIEFLNSYKIETLSGTEIVTSGTGGDYEWEFYNGYYYLIKNGTSELFTTSENLSQSLDFATSIELPNINCLPVTDNLINIQDYTTKIIENMDGENPVYSSTQYSFIKNGDLINLDFGLETMPTIKCEMICESIQALGMPTSLVDGDKLFRNFFENDKNDKCIVIFDTPNDCDAITPLVVDRGTSILIPDVVRDGFVFNGWVSESKNDVYNVSLADYFYKANTQVKINGNMYFSAKFTNCFSYLSADTYLLTYETNGGSLLPDTNVKVGAMLGEAIFKAKTTRIGYTFLGWYYDKNFTREAKSSDIVTEAKNQTLYAKWVETEYNIVVDANGGAGSYSLTAMYGQRISLSEIADNFSKTNFDIYGFSLSNVESEVNYFSNFAITLNNDFLSSITKYKVKIFGETQDDTIIISNGQDNTIYLFIVWKGQEIKVYFDVNGGSFSDSTIATESVNGVLTPYTIVYYGEQYGAVKKLPYPIKQGYVFDGWTFNDNSETKLILDGNVVGEKGEVDDKKVNLTASWRASQYMVHFDVNGGKEMIDEDGQYITHFVMVYGQTVSQVLSDSSINNLKNNSLPIPTKTGYSFAGWSTDKNATESSTFITDDTVLTFTSNTTLYAQWQAYVLNIRYYFVYGNSSDEEEDSKALPVNQTVIYYDENKYLFTINDIKALNSAWNLNGLTFAGWSQSRDSGTEIVYEDGAKIIYTMFNVTENNQTFNLYAKWNLNEYNIVYNYGFNYVSSNVTKFTIETERSRIIEPVRLGYKFIGWSGLNGNQLLFNLYLDEGLIKQSADGVNFTNVTTVPSSYYLTANYTLSSYVLSYDLKGGSFVNTDLFYTTTYNITNTITLPSSLMVDKKGYKFAGWKCDLTDVINEGVCNWKNGEIYTLYQMPAGSMYGNAKLVAQWKVETYYITYKDNSVQIGDRQEYTVESNVILRDYPSKNGYTVSGWRTNTNLGAWSSSLQYTAGQEIDTSSAYCDVTLNVVASVNNYSITYSFVSCSPTSSNYTTNYTINDAILLPTVTTRTGYVCVGFEVTNNSLLSSWSGIYPAGSTLNNMYGFVTLSVVWSPITYTISYNANGGTGAVADTKHTYNNLDNEGFTDKVLSLGEGFTRNACTLIGWGAKPNATVPTYNLGSPVTNLSSDNGSIVTLYAVWRANTYTITYDTNGGNIISTSYTTSYNIFSVINFPNCSKAGGQFANWKVTTVSGSWTLNTLYTVDSKVSGQYGDVTLTAQYVEFTHNFIINPNGGTMDGSTNSKTVTMSSQNSTVSQVVTRAGFEYSGATVVGDDSVEVTYSSSSGTLNIKLVTFGVVLNGDANTYITLNWNPIKYTVVYNANGGTGSMQNSNHTYNVAKTLNVNQYAKQGYKFSSWNTVQGGTGTSYADGATVSNLSITNNGTVTLYAQWEALTVVFEYQPNGADLGFVETDTWVYNSGNYTTLTAERCNFVRYGYNFVGWALTQNATTAVVQGGGTITNATAVSYFIDDNVVSSMEVRTLYAVWSVLSYNIQYKYKDGSTLKDVSTTNIDATHLVCFESNENVTTSFNINQQIYLPKALKNGMRAFYGWRVNATNGSFTAGEILSAGNNGSNHYLSSGNLILVAEFDNSSFSISIRYLEQSNNSADIVKVNNVDVSSNVEVVEGENGTNISRLNITRAGYYISSIETARTDDGLTIVKDANNVIIGLSYTISTLNNSITIRWTAKTYKVTFNANGGTFANPNYQTQNFGAYSYYSSIILPQINKTGYTFSHWATSNNASSQYKIDGMIYFINQIPSNESVGIQLYAIYTANAIEIIYNSNGGTGSMDNQLITYGSDVTIKRNAFVKIGYTFEKWNTKLDGNGTDYTAGATITNLTELASSGAVNLYAIWSVTPYTITLQGISTSNVITYDILTKVTLPSVTQTGADFLGWQLNSSSEGTTWLPNVLYNGEQAVGNYGSITLAPSYNTKSYSLRINLNGGTASASSSSNVIVYSSFILATGTYGQVCEIPNITRVGYDLLKDLANYSNVGSFTSGSGHWSYSFGAGNETVDLEWKAKQFTIKYNANGGVGSSNLTTTATFDTATTLISNPFTKEGYVFSNWCTSASVGNNTLLIGEKINLTPNQFATYVINNEITLYVIWTPITYIVSFDGNGNTNNSLVMDNIVASYGTEITIPDCDYIKNGYTFIKWNTANDGSGRDFAPGDKLTNLSNVNGYNYVIYATWDLTQYDVRLIANGGVYPGNENYIIINVNQAGTGGTNGVYTSKLLETKPTRTGYTFVEYNTSADGNGTKITSTSALFVNGHHELYAIWTANSYTVTFDTNNGGTLYFGNAVADSNQITVTYDKTYGQNVYSGNNSTSAPNLFTLGSDYVFSGWYLNAEDENSLITKDSVVQITENTTLFALYLGATINVEAISLQNKYYIDNNGTAEDFIYDKVETEKLYLCEYCGKESSTGEAHNETCTSHIVNSYLGHTSEEIYYGNCNFEFSRREYYSHNLEGHAEEHDLYISGLSYVCRYCNAKKPVIDNPFSQLLDRITDAILSSFIDEYGACPGKSFKCKDCGVSGRLSQNRISDLLNQSNGVYTFKDKNVEVPEFGSNTYGYCYSNYQDYYRCTYSGCTGSEVTNPNAKRTCTSDNNRYHKCCDRLYGSLGCTVFYEYGLHVYQLNKTYKIYTYKGGNRYVETFGASDYVNILPMGTNLQAYYPAVKLILSPGDLVVYNSKTYKVKENGVLQFYTG